MLHLFDFLTTFPAGPKSSPLVHIMITSFLLTPFFLHKTYFSLPFPGELHWGIDTTTAHLERVLHLYKSGLYLKNVTRTPKSGIVLLIRVLQRPALERIGA